MTNKEAIFKLIKYRRRLEEDYTIDADAFDMAIEALEENESLAKSLNDAVELIHKLQKKNEWIPCSERLPEEDRTVFVTRKRGTDKPFIATANYSLISKKWYPLEIFSDVIAWMPLPTPFKS